MGDLNWLSISTRLDITTIHSILSAYSHCPSAQHLASALHVVKYYSYNPSHGLFFSYQQSQRLTAFVTYPVPHDLTAYLDANWGPIDASIPKNNTKGSEQSILSLRSVSGWTILNQSVPIAWGSIRQTDTAQSSC